MSIADPEKRILDAPYEDFATSLLPLYSDPHVRIRIGSASREYKLSKALLCKQSPYFAATFEGKFQEREEQSTTLTEIDGVVSTRSFELLVQWLYLGRVVFGNLTPKESITTTIEFVRLADMCGVTGVGSLMAERIKAIIKANPAPPQTSEKRYSAKKRDPDTNTYCITSQNITSAAFLPGGHSVRNILATAAVEGYLRHDNHKFREEAQNIPNFSVDLLNAVRITLKKLTYKNHEICFEDPFSGKTLPINNDDVDFYI